MQRARTARRDPSPGGLLRLRASLSGGAPVWLFNLALMTGAAAVHVRSVGELTLGPVPLTVPWWLLVPAFYLVETHAVHLELRRDAHSFTLGELPLTVGLALCSPVGLVMAQLIGLFIALVQRRQPLPKMIFNLANQWLSLGIAATIFYWVSAGASGLDPRMWGALIAAVVVGSLVEVGFIFVVMHVAGAGVDIRKWAESVTLGLAVTVTNGSIAVLGVSILWYEWRAIWLLAIPTVVLLFAYRAYKSQRQQHESLEQLYESSRVLHRAREVELAAAKLLTQAKEMFRAETAEIVLFASASTDVHLRALLGGDGRLEVTKPTALESEGRAWAGVVLDNVPTLLSPDGCDAELQSYLRYRHIRNGICAPLREDSGVFGVMLVANRLGDVTSYGPRDLRLFETLAYNASASLGNARLMERLRRQADENEYQALHDALTGLPNRTLFRDRLEQAIRNGREKSSAFAVMIMDLNHFKEVNDTLGHHNGDLLLQEIARRLASVLDPADTVARLSGDEFAILLPEARDRQSAAQVARRLVGSLTEPFVLQEVCLEVGASIGIACYPENGTDANLLLQRADVAMYLAKDSHRDFEFYSEQRDQYSAGRLALAAELRRALDNKELFLQYQPKAELGSGRVVGAEALVRWIHPVEGFMPPDEFIPLAERTGLIGPLTLYVLNSAIGQCREWLDKGLDLRVAVNLSVRNLLDLDLPRDIGGLLTKWGVSPDRLVLEITESTIMADPVRALEVVNELQRMGLSLAIDDFGTGYSSLAYLKRLPVEEIKIDRSFVMSMMADDNDAVIVRSTVDLGRNLGLRVVAEGVETAEMWDSLAELGCDIAQGYYLSRPLKPAEFETWLAERTKESERSAGDLLRTA
ncbi:MAG: putative bifunctional diguanylate cyclase/phosphodiesterase [Actinomycetota bacterium]